MSYRVVGNALSQPRPTTTIPKYVVGGVSSVVTLRPGVGDSPTLATNLGAHSVGYTLLTNMV